MVVPARYTVRLITILVMISFIAIPLLAPADDAGIEIALCPAGDELGKQLSERLDQSRDTARRLDVFITGEQAPDSPPSALFTIDLQNEAAVQRRVIELKQIEADPALVLSPMTRTLLDCAARKPDLDDEVRQLRESERRVNELRLNFLSLPLQRRQPLVNIQAAVAQQQQVIEQLEGERVAAESQREKATSSLEAAAEVAKTAPTADLRELAAQRTVIERVREELANLKVELTTDLAARTKESHALAARLIALAGQYSIERSPDLLAQAYVEVSAIWRQIADDIFARITDQQRYASLPALPEFPATLLRRLGNEPAAESYRISYQAAERLRQELIAMRESRQKEGRENAYALLLKAGQLRSQLLQANLDAGNDAPLNWSGEYFRDVLRELHVVPYRWIAITYAKLVSFRFKLASGFTGIADILQQIALFLLLLAIPFVLYRGLRLSTHLVNQLRQSLVQRQIRSGHSKRYATLLAIGLHRINAYLPWILMLVALRLAGTLLAHTDLPEFFELLIYLEYYVWYRLLIQLAYSLINVGLTTLRMPRNITQRMRIHHSVRQIGLFFLVALIILHATENVVGEALVYRAAHAIMVYIGIFVCAYSARQWRMEIRDGLAQVLPDHIADQIGRLCVGPWSWLACLPGLIIISGTLLLQRVHNWLEQFDITKQLSAELFRRKVESVINKQQGETIRSLHDAGLPEDYLALFDLNVPLDKTLLIEPSADISGDILTMARNWGTRGGDNAVVVYGYKGSGKSCLLELIARGDLPDLTVTTLAIPPKLCTANDVRGFLRDILPAETGPERPESAARTLMLLDDAQNVFLARPGGFEGYRELLNIIGATVRTHFWCAVFNQSSWNYLTGAFDSEPGFLKTREMPPMTEDDLRNLILRRHRQQHYELSYDSIIRATQNPDDDDNTPQVEAQFFRLLWGLAKGNPRAALVLWLSALKLSHDGRLHVSVPSHRKAKAKDSVGENGIFVYSAVIKHENLSFEETVSVTNLPAILVRNTLRAGVEQGLLTVDDKHRYRVSPTAQFSITQFLIERNHLHE
jgi:hypothetical protein